MCIPDNVRNVCVRDPGLRIGHILLSPSLLDRLVDAEVDRHMRGREKTSNRAPLWIELGAASL